MECPSCGNVNREGARFCDDCGSRLGAVGSTPASDVVSGRPRGGSDPPGLGALPPDSPTAIGDGRYVIDGFLGETGLRRVYLASEAEGERRVVVAVFNTAGLAEAAHARVRREALAMGRLGSHEHIVAVHDSGVEDGRPWVASEYMAGGDLVDLLEDAEGGRLPVERALAIAADVCRGLEHAHSRGIVHRDLKPGTVWLDRAGAARLGDFGLATISAGSRESLEGMPVGTVAYLPPEQALGRPSEPRSDLYSLGALIYEMLTGQPPFAGDDAVAIIGRHLTATPVPPSRQRPTVPPALDDLVLRLLAKSVDERPASAAAVSAELEEIAAAPGRPAAPEPDENPLERLAERVFVGRGPELEELRGAVEDALAGRGRLLLLVGEPGIGKTRTAEELATYARVRGAAVHWGRCHEGEGAPAYWPWAEAIRSYLREAEEAGISPELGRRARELAAIVPELAGGRAPSAPAAADAERDRFRLFDAVASLLTEAVRTQPLVIVLDDLHWADESSLLMLKFIARQLGGSGLLIVGTYRDVELGRHHPLGRALGELTALTRSSRVVLRGLDVGAIERYVEMTVGSEPPPGLAEAIHAQTEGNPFFVGEVVRLLASEGALERASRVSELEIPQGVREVVGRRLDRLSEGANATLTAAAAIGREFRIDVLGRVIESSPEEIEAALGEGVDAQLLRAVEATPGLFSFSHALVRETLYDEIAGPRRVRMHAEIARALEEVHAGDLEPHLAELAHHFIEAAPTAGAEKAIDYAGRAACQATQRLAHEDAAAHYQRALEVLPLRGRSDPRAELGLRLAIGEAQTRAGRFGAARETLEAAATLARGLGDHEALVRAALGISELSEAGKKDEAIVSLLTEALDAVGPAASGERARLLCGLAGEYVWEDPQGRALPLVDEAADVARAAHDPSAEAAALGWRQLLLAATPEAIRERLETTSELLAVAERSGDRSVAVRAHAYRLSNLIQLGDVAGADRELDVYARLAEALREPRHLWRTPMMRATRALMEGRFDDARRLSREAARAGERAEEPISAQFHAVQMALLHTFEGSVEEMLPEVRRMAERYPAIIAWRMALVSFLTEAGRLEEARVEFERLTASGFEDAPVDLQWLTGMARLGEAAAALSDVERSRVLYERLAPFAGQAVVSGVAAASNGPVDRYLGMLARALGRPSDAIAHLEAAVEMASRMGDRPWRADSRVQLAAALLDRGGAGDRERALALLTEALDEAQELGMRRLIERGVALRLAAHGVAGADVTTSLDAVVADVESEQPDIAALAAADGRVTILFSDIENSTLMTERLGDRRWIDVLRSHNAVFRDRVRLRGGYEVKSQGDGFMLAFPDPALGLACATEIQRELERSSAPEEERVRVRMGLHTGEAIAEEGDLFGRTVVLAARIAAQARGGEVLVSETLRQAALATSAAAGERPAAVGAVGGAGAEEFRFDEGRELELKGLAGSHRVFRVEWEPEPAPAS